MSSKVTNNQNFCPSLPIADKNRIKSHLRQINYTFFYVFLCSSVDSVDLWVGGLAEKHVQGGQVSKSSHTTNT
jgi:hypothetical protein